MTSPRCAPLTLILLISTLIVHFNQGARAEPVKEALTTNATLSTFASLAQNVSLLNVVLLEEGCTVFAPTNDAFKITARNPQSDEKIARLHIALNKVSKELFPTRVSTYLSAAPRLYLSKKETNTVDGLVTEYYVNNAKIVGGPFYFKSSKQKDQVLYQIDEVINAYPAQGDDEGSVPWTAKQVLQDPSKYIGQRYSGIGSFAQRVQEQNLNNLFDEAGEHTYFIPITIESNIIQDIDKTVVRGHVIPNNTLFLRTMDERVYHSTAFDDKNQVELSVDVKDSTDSTNTPTYYIQANTLRTSGRHHQGISKQKVYKANVPVTNGVIHFIEKPLMIISSSIFDILDVEKVDRFSQFFKFIEKDEPIKNRLQISGRTTVFAPTDKAFMDINDRLKALSHDELMSIIRLHIVPDNAISSELVKSGTKKALSLADSKELFFDVYEKQGFRTLTVEGGGVNATAIQADIGATNGIVHIIDRILGVPYQTMKEKLEEDSNILTSYKVASRSPTRWVDRLGSNEERFTFFAPSQEAWKIVEQSMPSEYKQLTQGLYPQNSEWILNRHLHVGEALTAEKLRGMKTINTERGNLEVSVNSKNDLVIKWEDVEATVTRSDVHAMNGVIHEIDMVLMKKRDLQVSPAAATMNNKATILISNLVPFVWFLLIKFI